MLLHLFFQVFSVVNNNGAELQGEPSFCGDNLLEGGQLGLMHNGVNYREVRQYVRNKHLVRFYFVTRSYNQYMETILKDIAEGPSPDVVIMNSCLWDISRYTSCLVCVLYVLLLRCWCGVVLNAAINMNLIYDAG